MKNRKFIQGAIKHPGAFREEIKREFGEAGFEPFTGNIKPSIEREIAEGKCPICGKHRSKCFCPSATQRKRARFAMMLRRLRK